MLFGKQTSLKWKTMMIMTHYQMGQEIKLLSKKKSPEFLTDQYNKISKERDELKTQVQQLQFKITQLEKNSENSS